MSQSVLERDKLITENKLICEFLEAELQGGYDNKELAHTELYCFKSYCSPTNLRTYSTGAMRFNTDWNWIMLVIDKIEEIGTCTIFGKKLYSPVELNKYGVEIKFAPKQDFLLDLKIKNSIKGAYKHPMYKTHIQKQFDFIGEGKLAGVYFAIVTFIKWYNENQKSINSNN